ncbi:hypothetical protein C427_3753 [Paraglaciecola psychrophila 170]|uniref:Uncharacterized protein n=1 Tax=Paraglaciecola psychrophila 170 TaxID=1129794 RepID=K7A9V8_9ALTE|nr:hypothetical protein C427_3753 [Paraglaciecola psychrophila 170]GAC37518.1 hypothetical protein GPSY_1894 [Paraglaciecola psychrophila 170]
MTLFAKTTIVSSYLGKFNTVSFFWGNDKVKDRTGQDRKDNKTTNQI